MIIKGIRLGASQVVSAQCRPSDPDGTLWLDVGDLFEVDAVRARLSELGVRATVLVADSTCATVVDEVS